MKATSLTSRNLTADVYGRRAPPLADSVFGMLIFVSPEGATPWVRTLLGAAALSGTCFVFFQGFEWMRLIAYGMTMTSGIFGACFFLLIGTHGLHAAAAAIAMVYLYGRLRRHELRPDHVQAMQVFWYFVVGIWPVLYGLVYF